MKKKIQVKVTSEIFQLSTLTVNECYLDAWTRCFWQTGRIKFLMLGILTETSNDLSIITSQKHTNQMENERRDYIINELQKLSIEFLIHWWCQAMLSSSKKDNSYSITAAWTRIKNTFLKKPDWNLLINGLSIYCIHTLEILLDKDAYVSQFILNVKV